MSAFVDISGQQFGRLTVIERNGRRRGGIAWLCQCECGKQITTTSYRLRSEQTRSCGCLHRERAKAQMKMLVVVNQSRPAHLTHGHTKNGAPTRTYVAWQNMIGRCENSNNERYVRYGGRGISVCSRWHTFEAFLEDMGACPPRMQLERNDNDGNYETGNCRWATAKEQARNRRTSRLLNYNGTILTVAEWAERTGIRPQTIYSRLYCGWSTERALEGVK